MKTVLIVDDNKCVRDVLHLALQDLPGCSIMTAGDGAEALTILDSFPVDAVITDLSMPVMDGYQLIKQIRARSEDLPVLAMSCEPRSFVLANLGMWRIGRYFEKPFDLEEVAREISSLLGLVQNAPLPVPPVRAALFDHHPEHAVPW